ncbi:MAG: hypothetical protein UY07_C0006G0033 [Parcubacteria group bacterium GW2011_GWA1_47_8]|nr:MAG: hypothetical protein UY07_C0006G0033 [Parcubacteria group bacterium GW2011_GWA1_47_8]
MEPIIPRPPQPPQKIPVPKPLGEAHLVPKVAPSSTLLRIRTMKSDSAIAINQQNESLVSIALAAEKQKAAREQAKAQEMLAEKKAGTQTAHPTHKRGRIFIVLGVVIILGVLGGGGVLLWPKISTLTFSFPNFGKPTDQKETPLPSDIPTKPAQPLAPSLAPAQSEKRLALDINNLQGIFSTIATERIAGLTEKEIRNIYFVGTGSSSEGSEAPAPISARQLFSTLGISIPNILSRSLETSFMTGLVGESGNTATPFVILKVSSRDSAFAGMLEWESGLPNFFNTFFGTTIPHISTGKSAVGKFRDTVVWKHDTRIFENGGGTIVYAFADAKTIIITSSKNALETLLPLFHKNTDGNLH